VLLALMLMSILNKYACQKFFACGRLASGGACGGRLTAPGRGASRDVRGWRPRGRLPGVYIVWGYFFRRCAVTLRKKYVLYI